MSTWFRRQAAFPRRVLVAGALVGMILALAVITVWSREERGFTIEVLGSGNSVSVLITHDHRKVLLVSGSDGAEFSNALASSVTPLDDDFDLVLLDQGASASVIERARSLDAQLIVTLPGGESGSADVLAGPMSVTFDDDAQLSIETTVDDGWFAVVSSGDARVLITNGSAEVGALPEAPVLIAIGNAENAPGEPYAAVIAASSSDILATHSVRPGESITITFDGDQIRLPGT